MSNKNLMTVIIVLLLGIFTILFIQANERSPSEKIGDSVSEAVEEIGDEIGDSTAQ